MLLAQSVARNDCWVSMACQLQYINSCNALSSAGACIKHAALSRPYLLDAHKLLTLLMNVYACPMSCAGLCSIRAGYLASACC